MQQRAGRELSFEACRFSSAQVMGGVTGGVTGQGLLGACGKEWGAVVRRDMA